MPSGDTQTQSQTTHTVSDPWGPAIGPLKDLIAKYTGLNTDVTGNQSGAISDLLSAVKNIPSFLPSASDAISKMFSLDTSGPLGMLSGAFNTAKNALTPITTASLNPYETPGFSDAINTMTSDITKGVKSVYAGSGRDPSGAGSFAGSLGRGLTQGLAPAIASQFNANVGNRTNAANSLVSDAGNTSGGFLSALTAPLTAAMSGLGMLPALTGAATQPASAELGAANTAFTQPFGNLSAILGPIMGMAGLGGTSDGTAKGTVTQPQSLFSNILGGGLGGLAGLSMLGPSGSGALGGATALLGLLSDENAKENIEEVGKLHDGQPVFRFNYKGEPGATQIGLLAQKVQKRKPKAVNRFGGMLHVNYGRATDDAARMAA